LIIAKRDRLVERTGKSVLAFGSRNKLETIDWLGMPLRSGLSIVLTIEQKMAFLFYIKNGIVCQAS
jgi:hypothetical protein